MAIDDQLISWWELEELIGTRKDSAGTNDLTDNNTTSHVGIAVVDNGAWFQSANSEYLSIANNASLQVGDIDFTVQAWVFLQSISDQRPIIGKWASGTLEYILYYDSGTATFKIAVSVNGSSLANSATAIGTPAIGQWYCLHAWHDSVNNQLGISVNAGTPVFAAHSTGVFVGTSAFEIGRNAASSFFFHGFMDQVGFWKRILTAEERQLLYNLGFGYQTYEYTIDGVNHGVTSAVTVERNSFYFEERLASRNTGAFTVSVSMQILPEVFIKHGHAVEVWKNRTKVFAGRIRQPRRYMIGVGQSRKRYICPIVDYSEAFDRRVVAAAVYENRTLKYIVDDINALYLSGEGFSTTGVETGPTFKKLTFSYKTVAWVFNELGRLSGYSYWSDYDKVIQFRSRNSVLGENVTEINAFGFEVTESIEGYRNVQYLRAGLQLTSDRVETFVGDGERRTFAVGFELGKVPTVEENRNGAGYVTKVMGIKGLHTGYDWYWNKGSAELTQDTAGTVMAAVDKLRVTYKGQFPISHSLEDGVQIAMRADVEGHSGRYENFEEDRSIDDSDAALDKVIALLERYGMIADVVKFNTYANGYHAGELILVTHTKLGLNGVYLIESVVVNPESPTKWRYGIRAIGGNSVGMWQEYFQALVQRADVVNENEILQFGTGRTDSCAVAESLTYIAGARESRIDFAMIDMSEIG